MWGSTTYDLQPDMITCAKGLSSGYLPIGAVMVSEPIYDVLVKQSEKIGVFSHGFTYSGHPVTSAVALETLKIYEEDGILAHVRVGCAANAGGAAPFRGSPAGGRSAGHRTDRRGGTGGRQSDSKPLSIPPREWVRIW